MYCFCVEEKKGLAYHLESLRVPLVVRVPQFGNHCATEFGNNVANAVSTCAAQPQQTK